MKNKKRLLYHIGLIFFAIVFSKFIVSLGDDAPPFMERPLRCISLILVLSMVGGYVTYWVEMRGAKKAEAKEHLS